MKIKPRFKKTKPDETKTAAKLGRELKYLFGTRNRPGLKGMFKKPKRWAGKFKEENIMTITYIYAHTFDKGIVKRNIDYIKRDIIENYKREHEESIINDKNISHWKYDNFHYMMIITQKEENELMLDGLTTEFVSEMEKDLGTKLEWVAAVHRNTDNPHVHLMIRGKDDGGNDLEIRKEYLHGVTNQSIKEIATARIELDKINNIIRRSIKERGIEDERQAIQTIERTITVRDI